MKHQALQQPLPSQQPHRNAIIEPQIRARPQSHPGHDAGSRRLEGRVALIAGGDKGIGRAVAIAFARQGADVAFIYHDEHGEAAKTVETVEDLGRECLKIAIDVGDEALCGGAVDQVVAYFGKLDILVNNAAEQHPQESLEDLTEAQLLRTFQANVFSMFYLTKAALPHLDRGARIINTTSVAAYRGNSHLLDFAATNGAIVAFTRSLSLALVQRGILVNGVAAGPVATAPISSTLDALGLAGVGADTPMQRAAQPDEIAACYVFLASAEASYMSGQILHPNGGEIING
jgi:NAD(P)-dependent dehydrogenase (short-subunit alcohol dehydrogenase family)